MSINKKFRRGRKLGQGSFGLVWQAEDKETRQLWALKVVKLVKSDDSYDIEKAKREVENVQKIWENGALDPRRRHIIQIAEAWQLSNPHDPEIRNWIEETWLYDAPPVDSLYVIQMEFCNHQSLHNWLRNPEINGNLDEGRNFFYQIAQGLSFLHDHSCIHRDLKPGNILLTKVNEGGSEVVVVKIGDFGSSRIRLPDSESSLTSAIGTDIYASPEQLSRRRNPDGFKVDYTTQSDIFSLGVIFFCIHSPPKKVSGPEAVKYYQHLEEFRQEDTKIPAEFCEKFSKETELLRRMLSNDPDRRPTAHQIIFHFSIIHPDLLRSKNESGQSSDDEPVDMELDTESDETICIEKFDESEKNKLLTLINRQSNQFNSMKLVKLDIRLVVDWRILMSFLELTASTSNSIKLRLKVDTSLCLTVYKSPESPIKFCQVTALNFESLEQETQLLCLIDIVRNSPNLRALSIGHFSYYVFDTVTSNKNIIKFLGTVSLQNLEFSCGFVANLQLTKELFVQLKGNGVRVKKLGFNWDRNYYPSEIMDLVKEDLEELHYFYRPTFQCRLNKLKILGVSCDYKTLLEVLGKTPNIQKLFHKTIFTTSAATVKQVSLPQLTSLSACMMHKEDPEYLSKMFSDCPNLSRLTCINYAQAKMAPIYEKFSHIKKFRYVEAWGVSIENVVGINEYGLKPQYLKYSIRSRTAYIGHFKELTSLSFAYKDYQRMELVADWDLDIKAFTHGIGDLTKLEKISFPPMALGRAKKILTFLTSSDCGMTQLTLVELQLWSGKHVGLDMTMSTTDIERLAEKHARRFEVDAKPVRYDDAGRCFEF